MYPPNSGGFQGPGGFPGAPPAYPSQPTQQPAAYPGPAITSPGQQPGPSYAPQPVPQAFAGYLGAPSGMPSYSQPPAGFTPPTTQWYTTGPTGAPQPYTPPAMSYQPASPAPGPTGPVTYTPPQQPTAPQPQPAPQPGTSGAPGPAPGTPSTHPFAQLGAAVAQYIGQPQPGQQRPAWAPPVDFNPRWVEDLYVEDPRTGGLTVRPGADPLELARSQQWMTWFQNFERTWKANPYEAIKPGLQDWVRQTVESTLNEQIGRRRDNQAIDDFVTQHGVWMFHADPYGRPLVNPQNGQRILSPVGQQFVGLVQQAEQAGIRSGAEQLRYAQALLWQELAARQRANSQTQALPPPTPVDLMDPNNPVAQAQSRLLVPYGAVPPPTMTSPYPGYPAVPTALPPGPSLGNLAQTAPGTPPGAGYTPGVAPQYSVQPTQYAANGIAAPSPYGQTFTQFLNQQAQQQGLLPPPGTTPFSFG
jgi:hypothetical protein